MAGGHQRFQINIPAQILELQTGKSYCLIIIKARNLMSLTLIPMSDLSANPIHSTFKIPSSPYCPYVVLPYCLIYGGSWPSSKALVWATSFVRSAGPPEGALLLCFIAWGQWGPLAMLTCICSSELVFPSQMT